MYSTQKQIDAERQRTKEKEAINRANLIKGMIMAPIYLFGWMPVLWIVIKVFGK